MVGSKVKNWFVFPMTLKYFVQALLFSLNSAPQFIPILRPTLPISASMVPLHFVDTYENKYSAEIKAHGPSSSPQKRTGPWGPGAGCGQTLCPQPLGIKAKG